MENIFESDTGTRSFSGQRKSQGSTRQHDHLAENSGRLGDHPFFGGMTVKEIVEWLGKAIVNLNEMTR
jgi:hypothetical protein